MTQAEEKTEEAQNPWDRNEGESDMEWHAFAAYRDLGTSRSLSACAREIGKSKGHVHGISKRWGWRDRVIAWDAHCDSVKQKATLKALEEWQRRHIEQSMKMQKAAMACLDIYITTQKTSNAPLMKPQDIKALMETGVKIERQTRGEPDSKVQVDMLESGRRDQLREMVADMDKEERSVAIKMLKVLFAPGNEHG